ncbi:MAG: MFS transporter [Tissierellia bacterium]|nr:MFS transporter [Tissierellia bacterium]
MNRKKIQILYSLLQGFYWVLFGVTISFANSYLSGLGVGADFIGLTTALFSGLAALAQVYLAKLARKNYKYNWKSLLLVLLFLRFLMNFLLLFVQTKVLASFLFGMAIFAAQSMLPFISTANFYYASNGLELDYGLARGAGSLFFAIMTIIVGNLVANYGILSILTTGIIACILFFIPLILLPYDHERDFTGAAKVKEEVKSGFFKKYPQFSISLLAFIFIMVIHNNTNTFLLQIIQNVGASNRELGKALFIAAIFELPVMFYFSRLLKKFKTKSMLMVSSLAFALKTFIYLISTDILGIYLSQSLQLLSFALFIATCVYYTQDMVELEDSQQAQSMTASSITLGSVFGSLIGGFLIKNYSLKLNLWVMIGFSLASFVILSLVKDGKVESRP